MLDRALLKEMGGIVGREQVLTAREDLLVYECDGYTIDKAVPDAVVLPATTDEVAAVVRLCHRERVPFLARGAGTGLSAGCLALNGGIQIALTRMNRIEDLDLRNRRALVQAGVVNLHVTQAAAGRGFAYAPDPSSQMASTIGGNIAENSGGPHTLKYGVTTNHVLGLEMVLPDGEVVWLGERAGEAPGYDLRGAAIGSEGTFGIVTRALVRLIRQPQALRTLLAVYDRVDDASETISAVIAQGIIPAALEMMDNVFIRAVEAASPCGLPVDAAAVLIIELDGFSAGIDEQAEAVRVLCAGHGARQVRLAADDTERAALWYGRKRAFGSVGRLSPSYCTQDGVIPRSQVAPVLREIAAIAGRHGLRVGNVFHAGDGNLHPVLLFDERDADQVRRVLAAGDEILRLCVETGGSLTGEHGIGLEKIGMMPYLFSDADMDAMRRVKAAFDPHGRCNPGKVLPAETTPKEERRQVTSGSWLVEVQVLLPAGAVLAGPEAAAYIVDGVVPAAVVLPESAEQVAELLRIADRHGAAVCPVGGGTHLGLGNPPARCDLALSLSRLSRRIEHEPGEMVVVADAGVRLTDLQARLAQHGQWLPVEPPGVGRMAPGEGPTLGGLLAIGASGASALGYGALREHLIGIRAALADGSLIRNGARVVKNVAGYDLCRLFTGSLGTLGVLVEATFKVRPLPAARAGVVATFPDARAAGGALDRLADSEIAPVIADLSNPAGSAAAGRPAQWRLALRFDGTRADVAWQSARARELLVGAAIAAEDAAPEAVSDALGETGRGHPDAVACRVTARSSDLMRFLEALGDDRPACAHALSGVCRVFLRADEGAVPLVAQLRDLAAGRGGTLVVESAPAALRPALSGGLEVPSAVGSSGLEAAPGAAVGSSGLEAAPGAVHAEARYYEQGAPAALSPSDRRPAGQSAICNLKSEIGPAIRVMRALKEGFDPGGILNPGRFVGGL